MFRVFVTLSELEFSQAFQQIRRRILLLLFYDLSQRISIKQFRKDEQDLLVDLLVESGLLVDKTSIRNEVQR